MPGISSGTVALWMWAMLSLFQQSATTQPTPASHAPTELGVIEGRVVNAVTGEGIRGAALEIGCMETTVPGGRCEHSAAISGDDGSFRASGINPGRYLLMASSKGFYPTFGVTPVANVQGGVTSRNNIVKMDPEASIAGILSDADKAPVAGMEVSALRVMYIRGKLVAQREATALANEDGAYSLQKLRRGKYYVRARMPAPAKNSATYPLVQFIYPSANQFADAEATLVSPGGQYTGMNIHTHPVPTYQITGKVANHRDDLGSLTLRVEPVDTVTFMTEGWSAPVEASGKFSVAGVPQGRYVLRLLARLKTAAANMATGTVAKQDVVVGTNAIDGLTLSVDLSPAVNGRITAGDGDSVPESTELSLRSEEGTGVRARYQQDGKVRRFSFERTEPTKYSVEVKNQDGFYTKELLFNGRDARANLVDISAGGDFQVVIKRGAAELSGTLETPEPNEYPELHALLVTLIPESWNPAVPGTLPRALMSNNKKLEFSIKNLVPGNYVAVALPGSDGHFLEDPDFIRALEAEGTRVTLGEGERKRIAISFVPLTRVDAIRSKLGF